MSVQKIKEILSSLANDIDAMARTVDDLKEMVYDDVDISIIDDFKLKFTRNTEECICEIESKSFCYIYPKDVKKAMIFFTPKNKIVLQYELKLFQKIEKNFHKLKKERSVLIKKRELEGDFIPLE